MFCCSFCSCDFETNRSFRQFFIVVCYFLFCFVSFLHAGHKRSSPTSVLSLYDRQWNFCRMTGEKPKKKIKFVVVMNGFSFWTGLEFCMLLAFCCPLILRSFTLHTKNSWVYFEIGIFFQLLLLVSLNKLHKVQSAHLLCCHVRVTKKKQQQISFWKPQWTISFTSKKQQNYKTIWRDDDKSHLLFITLSIVFAVVLRAINFHCR